MSWPCPSWGKLLFFLRPHNRIGVSKKGPSTSPQLRQTGNPQDPPLLVPDRHQDQTQPGDFSPGSHFEGNRAGRLTSIPIANFNSAGEQYLPASNWRVRFSRRIKAFLVPSPLRSLVHSTGRDPSFLSCPVRSAPPLLSFRNPRTHHRTTAPHHPQGNSRFPPQLPPVPPAHSLLSSSTRSRKIPPLSPQFQVPNPRSALPSPATIRHPNHARRERRPFSRFDLSAPAPAPFRVGPGSHRQ